MKNKVLDRRTCLKQAAGLAATLFASGALAPLAFSQQVEEPLSHSMKTALTSAINAEGSPQLVFETEEEKKEHSLWLAEMSKRLERRIDNYYRRIEFLETIRYESMRAGLEPALVLGLVQTESAFRQYAVSVAGALGYMQVMPFWVRLIGDGDLSKLLHAQTNLRYGCVILRHYIDIEKGNLFLALGRYNGSRGQSKYPDSVFRHRQNWLFDAKG